MARLSKIALVLAAALLAGCSAAVPNREQYAKPATYPSWENEYRNTDRPPAWTYPRPMFGRLLILGGPSPYFLGGWHHRPERHRRHWPHRHH